ncbi:hypothetical protein AVEN_48267-1 [Araneus ventricosus]|uniref:Uncharacterized protein n=1 Tax=Araneus ventricosus TaxID=182803 RepID=A0A4Y2EPH9_ARAVE|nr:hypothetical protein AVEN_48267-1 [Araneus ventricosus]
MCKISNKLPEKSSYVLDGRDLLHRVHWPSPATYGDVCNAYLDYVNRNYGTNAIVVFDGYEATAARQNSLRVYIQVQAGRITSSQLKTGAGLSNRDVRNVMSCPLYPRRKTFCVSFVVYAKETAPEIMSASEVR